LFDGLISFKIGEKFKTKNSKDVVIYEKHKVEMPSTEASYNNPNVTTSNNVVVPNKIEMSDNVITVNRVEIIADSVATSQTDEAITVNKNEPIYNAIPVNTDEDIPPPYKENNKNI